MDMTEMSRLILGRRKLGLGDKELAGFLLWIENGESQYEPKPIGTKEEDR